MKTRHSNWIASGTLEKQSRDPRHLYINASDFFFAFPRFVLKSSFDCPSFFLSLVLLLLLCVFLVLFSAFSRITQYSQFSCYCFADSFVQFLVLPRATRWKKKLSFLLLQFQYEKKRRKKRKEGRAFRLTL